MCGPLCVLVGGVWATEPESEKEIRLSGFGKFDGTRYYPRADCQSCAVEAVLPELCFRNREAMTIPE